MEKRICKDCGRELDINMFKTTRYGGKVFVCNDCAAKKFRLTLQLNKEEKAKEAEKKKELSRNEILMSYTPRELMCELARRGYRGKLTYTETKEIDIANF